VTTEPAAVYLVKGADPSLVSQSVAHVLAELVGEDSGGFGVEDLTSDDLDVGTVIDACLTPAFLSDRRVVVVRDISKLRADDLDRLASYLADPLGTTSLVLATTAAVPARFAEAVRKAGHLVDAGVPSGRGRGQWLAARLREAPLRLDPAAVSLLGDHLGEDLGRLAGILGALTAAYGEGAVVGPEELEPFLGEAGSTAPWELTDAIDRADVAGALAALHRLTGAGQRHPLVILATLHRHFTSMLRLDGAGVSSDEEAAAVLGTRSTYPAAKARAQLSRLGPEAVRRAVSLLGQADLDLRGETGAQEEAVLEVLVARLARLAPPTRRRAATGSGRR